MEVGAGIPLGFQCQVILKLGLLAQSHTIAPSILKSRTPPISEFETPGYGNQGQDNRGG